MLRRVFARPHHTAVAAAAALRLDPVALLAACRCFTQGGPPPSFDDTNKNLKDILDTNKWGEKDGPFNANQRASSNSLHPPTREKYEENLEKIAAFYQTEQPDKPQPLPENTFAFGKFGMRRRLHVDRRRDRDLASFSDAMAESSNAFRK